MSRDSPPPLGCSLFPMGHSFFLSVTARKAWRESGRTRALCTSVRELWEFRKVPYLGPRLRSTQVNFESPSWGKQKAGPSFTSFPFQAL